MWARKRYSKVINKYKYITYMDKKFFDKISWQRKIKMSPKGVHEIGGVNRYKLHKIVSRHFPVEYLFLGVLRRLILRRNLGGCIHLEP